MYWIPTPFAGRLAIAPRPRGGDWLEDEVRAWKRSGVDVAVSLLTAEEAAELELGAEADACRAVGIRFDMLPIPDRGLPPNRSSFAGLAAKLADDIGSGRAVLIHCRQGIGRAGMLAVATLVAGGTAVDDAVRRVSTARGRPVPETPEQMRWLTRFAADFPEPSPAVAASNPL